MVWEHTKNYSVTIENHTKLNRLVAGMPSGAVLAASWLESRGYGAALRQQYVRRGWLAKVARGAYRRPGPVPGWEAVLSSLQCLEGIPVVVGGRTALDLAGFAHHLPQDGGLGLKLWSSSGLPGWFPDALPAGVTTVLRNPARLFRDAGVPIAAAAPAADGEGVRPLHTVEGEGVVHLPRGPDGWPLAVSSPERAVLELLHEVPAHETFEQADDIFGGLNTLSPARLRRLLPLCHHVRTLRLFAWFAKRHDHPWARHVDPGALDLGAGKRQLVPGGEMDAELGITVPRGMGRGGAGG